MHNMSEELTKEIVKALQPFGDLLHRLTGPLADEIGESLGVWMRHYRFRLAVKMFQKTQRMLAEAGISANPVPPRLFLPMLEHASIEDDDELHSRWSALLANASASPNSVHPSFIEILRQLTPDDAKLLDTLYDSSASRRQRKVLPPWRNWITYADAEARGAAGESFQNLLRLGLIQSEYAVDAFRSKVKLTRDGKRAKLDAELENRYVLAEFTMRFVRACRAPSISIGPTSN